MTSPRIDWQRALEEAAAIVRSYDTNVTLRQLHYRLVAAGTIPNTASAYKTLSARTAEARRAGAFPALTDLTRHIDRPLSWTGPHDALADTLNLYRRDRTEGQPFALYIGVEKHGLVAQLSSWFSDLGIPILALGGYSSQSFVDQVRQDIRRTDGCPVLLYAGDFDPSGEDIDRDFVERVGAFQHVERIALTPEQIDEYDLPPAIGKATDSRASQFVARHGRLVQVELDALPPDTLRGLYQQAIDLRWDLSTFEQVVAAEEVERVQLEELIEALP